jgi:DNA-binding response OmpR family regulator
MSAHTLRGRRVLVVEDELAIVALVESLLEDEHCQIVGPYGTVHEAIGAANSEALDLAVLDINLVGEMVFPVADVLAARGIPFLMLSGYGKEALPPNRRHWPVCGKPFRLDELISLLAGLIGTTPAAAA